MDENQKASEKILSLKIPIKYNEKKLLQEGTVLPVIASIRKRAKRFYHFLLVTASFLIILALIRVFLFNVSILDVLFPTVFGAFLVYFVHRNYNHIEDILKESESLLET
ncbi:MAG: hypothetical protein BalsKO_30750 [Balneolaceae bacterium]